METPLLDTTLDDDFAELLDTPISLLQELTEELDDNFAELLLEPSEEEDFSELLMTFMHMQIPRQLSLPELLVTVWVDIRRMLIPMVHWLQWLIQNMHLFSVKATGVT